MASVGLQLKLTNLKSNSVLAMKTCDICNRSSGDDDVVLYGEWMIKLKVTVHYFCLLLSTHLPQRGGDSSGILGFLIRDIRQEVNAAKKRKCSYCSETGASIGCVKCHTYFHLDCGRNNRCVSEFCGQFLSYCESCAPLDDYRRQLLADPPKNAKCDICMRAIKPFNLQFIIYGDCCRRGFAHRTCMQRYALSSGYYLRCIWCRKENFRDYVRMQSIFVPDRDAEWEREKNAFSELYNMHQRCDQALCVCPKGRDFNKNVWKIVLCKLCASTGAHSKCLPHGTAKDPEVNFKCASCIEVEVRLERDSQSKSAKQIVSPGPAVGNEDIDVSFYLDKQSNLDSFVPAIDGSPVFSDDDTMSTNSSQITVILSQPNCRASQRNVMEVDLAEVVIEETPPEQQRRLALKTSFNCPGQPYFYLVIYEFDSQEDCIGSCTLRFAEDDERIKDRSVTALEQLQFREEDVWCRSDDRGIYEKIDQYIAKL